MAWILKPRRSGDQYFVCWREGGRGSPIKSQAAGRTLAGARSVRDAIAAHVREGRIGGGVVLKRVTFCQFAGYDAGKGWLDHGWVAERTVRPKTLEREKYLLKNHLIPEFGDSVLYTITAQEVQAFVTNLAKKISPYSARRAHDVLRVIMSDAKRYGYVRENVAQEIHRPGLPHHEMRIPSVEDFCRVLSTLPQRHRPFVLALGLLGWRYGEATGARWDDVDLEGERLHVRRQIVSNTTTVAQPKSRTSLRSIELPPLVRNVLMDLPQRSEWLFPGVMGGPLNHRAFLRRVWCPTVRGLGLDGLHVHDMRHFAASLWFAWGRNILWIAQQLGHSSADITLRQYGHLLREGQRLEEGETLRKIEEAFKCAKPVLSAKG